MNNNIETTLNTLVSKLNVNFDVLWKCLLKQVKISMYINISILIIISILTCFFPLFFKIIKEKDKETKYAYEKEDMMIIYIIGSLFCLVCSIVFCVNMYLLVTKIYNPEYIALKLILK